jgi:hypothetical protein
MTKQVLNTVQTEILENKDVRRYHYFYNLILPYLSIILVFACLSLKHGFVPNNFEFT